MITQTHSTQLTLLEKKIYEEISAIAREHRYNTDLEHTPTGTCAAKANRFILDASKDYPDLLIVEAVVKKAKNETKGYSGVMILKEFDFTTNDIRDLLRQTKPKNKNYIEKTSIRPLVGNGR